MIILSSIVISNKRLLRKGALAFTRGTILAAGPAETIVKKFPGHRVFRLDDTVLLPGLVNVHTHLELPPLLEKLRTASFPDWVLALIKEKRKLTPADYTSAAKQNIETLKRTGTTTVGEICTHGVSPVCLKRSGLRAVIYREIISMNPASPPPSLAALRPRPASCMLRYGLSPHAPYTVSESVMLRIKELADSKQQRLAMHVSESKDEMRLLQGKTNCLEKLYQLVGWNKAWAPSADSPFEYLARLGLLRPAFLAVHAVQATDRDIRLLSKSRTPVVHCPRSNKELGVGKMPLKKFLNAGITIGLGTDSLASTPDFNMWDEMRYAYHIHKRDGITAEDILKLATIGGAKALGMDKEI